MPLPAMVTLTPSILSCRRLSRSCLRSPGPRTGCVTPTPNSVRDIRSEGEVLSAEDVLFTGRRLGEEEEDSSSWSREFTFTLKPLEEGRPSK